MCGSTELKLNSRCKMHCRKKDQVITVMMGPFDLDFSLVNLNK